MMMINLPGRALIAVCAVYSTQYYIVVAPNLWKAGTVSYFLAAVDIGLIKGTAISGQSIMIIFIISVD